MEEVRRRTSLAPLASPCFILRLLGLEAEGLLAFQGRAGITSIVRWNLRPVIFRVENTQKMSLKCQKGSSQVLWSQISGSFRTSLGHLRSAKTRVLTSKTRVVKHAFSKHSVARLEEKDIDSVLGCVLRTRVPKIHS